jgi:Glycosyl transferase family 11
MRYITCDILGPGDGLYNFGLCNQMFQVAALISHAHDNNLTVTFPQLKTPQFGGYNENIFSRVNTEDIDTTGFEYLKLPYGYHELPKRDKIIYRAYMQSEKYFAHNRDLILSLLEPTNDVKEYITSKYGDLLNKQTLSIHIRRGDYVHLPNHHPVTSMYYYIEATNYIISKTPIDAYMIFSDDIEWCKRTFGDEDHIHYIQGEKDYIDLYLMSMCRHNIIANSTFSWWGAWLNKNPDKIVIAPKASWFGPARADLDTKDLIPESWIKL